MKKIATVLPVLIFVPLISFAASTATSPCSFSSDLTIGSTGAAVTCLQQDLIGAGYSIPAGATGSFGAQTKSAVMAWQAAAGISPATGYFGSISRAVFSATTWGGSSSMTTVSSTAPGCSAGTSFSATTGQSCNTTTSTTYPPGCLSYSGYSATTGRSCGCFSGSGYDQLTGASCTPTLVAPTPPTPPAQTTPPPNTTLCNGTYYSACTSGEQLVCPSNGGQAYCLTPQNQQTINQLQQELQSYSNQLQSIKNTVAGLQSQMSSECNFSGTSVFAEGNAAIQLQTQAAICTSLAQEATQDIQSEAYPQQEITYIQGLLQSYNQ